MIESNASQIVAKMRARAAELNREIETVITNNVEYAIPVEYGSTREFKLSRKQIGYLKSQGQQKQSTGFAKVSKDPDGTIRIVTPPRGMIQQSIPEIVKYGRFILDNLSAKEFSYSDALAASEDIGMFALNRIIENTPVDTGRLRSGWDYKGTVI